ncbi:helix-turn-helix transcriptional regulator [Nonomuraea angiospora]|uniref:helix-turn-helix domain-containing protein n=1 Tax=Nonomuraea angiospora TaxID=46172 RepID=UPI0034443680
MTSKLSIGQRVSWYRRRRGMAQDVLAGLVGRTTDWLSKVENDRITLDRLSVIKSLANALDVSLGDLLAEPHLFEWTDESGDQTIPALRAAITDYRQLSPMAELIQAVEPPCPAELERLLGGHTREPGTATSYGHFRDSWAKRITLCVPEEVTPAWNRWACSGRFITLPPAF